MSRQKDRLWKRAKRSNSATHWDAYKLLRKQIKTATKRKYREFLTNLQSELKDNPKRFWSFYGAKTKSPRILKVVSLNNHKASAAKAKADLFIRFFASVFQKTNLHTSINTATTTNMNSNELHTIQASIDEVTKHVDRIKSQGEF